MPVRIISSSQNIVMSKHRSVILARSPGVIHTGQILLEVWLDQGCSHLNIIKCLHLSRAMRSNSGSVLSKTSGINRESSWTNHMIDITLTTRGL